jgi:hypothetical protein
LTQTDGRVLGNDDGSHVRVLAVVSKDLRDGHFVVVRLVLLLPLNHLLLLDHLLQMT